jgi:hypothetical protein
MSKEYKYEYCPSTKKVTKTNTITGEEWSWFPRPRPGKVVCNPSNGVTIQKLVEAGNNVRVKHLRLALYWAQPHAIGRNTTSSMRVIVVPSSFRKDPNYHLLPKGGFTHVVIKRPNGEYICVSSECSEDDPFCYNMGVCVALERLTPTELQLLGL